MSAPLLKFQREKHESLKGLLLPLLLLSGAVVLQLKLAWHVGSFDPIAGANSSFDAILAKTDNESLLISWMAKLGLSAPAWQLSTIFVHIVNIWLAFVAARRVFGGRLGSSIAIGALVGMNPLGIEALVWGCCLHQMLTLTWILLGLEIYEAHHHEESTPWTVFRVGGLAVLQILAFVTWDWGVIFFPIVAMISLAVPRPGPKHIRKRHAFLLLTSCGVIWLIGSLLVLRKLIDTVPLPFGKIMFSLLMAPVEGLLPLLKTYQMESLLGALLFIGVYSCLAAVCFYYKRNIALIAAFFISMLPWALFEQPSGSDFYLGLPFLYLTLASFKNIKSFGTFCLFVYLFFQFIWMFERIRVLDRGYFEAEKLKNEAVRLDPGVINFPETYRPNGLMVSSKIFFQGFPKVSEDVFRDFEVIEDETAFIIVPIQE